MPYPHPNIVKPLTCAWVLAAGIASASYAATDYAVVAGSAGNTVQLATQCRNDWRVTAELVSRPSWVSRADVTCSPVPSGADVRVDFDVSDAALIGARGTLVVAIEATDAQGQRVARSLRHLPLALASSAPEVQRSFQIEECCIPSAGIEGAQNGRPDRFLLLGAVPNPWLATTAIRFGLPSAASVSLSVLDLAGRVVWKSDTPELAPGYHQFVWDGRDVGGRRAPPGLYFYKVSAGPWRGTGKALRLR